MVAEPELDRFLTELNARRRLLSLAGTPGSPLDEGLIAELGELAEQLMVADVELRAQHEELEAAREALLRSQASYELLLGETDTAYLLTDRHGIVRQANPAAELMLGTSTAGHRASRPLATRFAVEDRGRIRTVLSRLTRSGEDSASCRAHLSRPDGSLLEVEVTARLISDLHSDAAGLSWQLRPVAGDGRHGLHSVPAISQPAVATDPARTAPGSGSGPGPESSTDLLSELSELATLLAGQHSAQDVLDQAVVAARHAVPGAEHASISLVDKDGTLRSPSSTGALAAECDQAQYRLGEGPCLQALWGGRVLLVEDLSTETRWPTWTAQAQQLGASSLLACQLATPRGVLGALNLYAGRPHAFDDAAVALIPVLAGQVGIALARVDNETSLQAAIQSRQLIGQAVGILMERHRLGPAAAFDLLVRASQDNNLKLREVAMRVNETGQEPSDAARS